MKNEAAGAIPKWLSRVPRFFAAVVMLDLLCVIAAGVLASEPDPSQAAESSSSPAPRSVVESFHAVLIDCMVRSDELGFAGRAQRVAKCQDETFDIGGSARRSVLRGWKRLDTEERTRWVALARQYWASKYAHEYPSFSGQNFETLGVEPASDEEVMVHARLARPNAGDVELDYRLRQVDGDWRIIDPHIAGGRSEVWRHREVYYSALERRNFDSLVTEIIEKMARFRTPTNPEKAN